MSKNKKNNKENDQSNDQSFRTIRKYTFFIDDPKAAKKKPENKPQQNPEQKPQKKYVITNIPQKIKGFTGYRIRALCDIGDDVKKGDLGGCVQQEWNLSQDGDCWIYPNAIVAGHATVTKNASITEGSAVYDGAVVTDDAKVCGSEICGTAKVCGHAIVNNSKVEDQSIVTEYAIVEAVSDIYGRSQIYGRAIIRGGDVESSKVHGNCIISAEYIHGGDYYERPRNQDDIVW